MCWTTTSNMCLHIQFAVAVLSQARLRRSMNLSGDQTLSATLHGLSRMPGTSLWPVMSLSMRSSMSPCCRPVSSWLQPPQPSRCKPHNT